jgi:transformation/transcription domain-associated protein
MVVFRHLLTTRWRRAILPHIDKLFDEDVLLGRGASSKEALRYVWTKHIVRYYLMSDRMNAYAALADLVHHVRNELSMQQLSHVMNVFSRLIHNSSLSCGVHTVVGKMLFGLVDTIVQKESPTEAAKVLLLLVELSVDKLESITSVLPDVLERIERSKKGEEDTTLVNTIEKARPIVTAQYLVDKPEDVLSGEQSDSNVMISYS